MDSTLTTVLNSPQPTNPPPPPLYPTPDAGTDPTSLLSLAIDVVGVLIAGAGLVVLLLQLRKQYARRAITDVAQVELPSHGGDENV